MTGWTPDAIKSLRRALVKTQNEFAAELGIDRTTLIRWETGRTKPGAQNRERLNALEDELTWAEMPAPWDIPD